MNNLLEIELENIDEITDKEKFKITDLNSANWAFRKLSALERKETEITDLAESERKRIAEWEKIEKESLKHSKDFFNYLLEEYYREQRKLDSKFKLSTPHGKVTSRKQQPKWNYEDEKTIEWLKENNKDLIRIKEEVDRAELKKKYEIYGSNVITEYGEIVEGITIEEREDSITIKVVE